MKFDFLDRGIPAEGTLILGLFEEKKLEGIAAEVDKKSGGSISRAIATKDFKGKKDDAFRLIAPAGVKISEIIVFGLGKEKDLTQLGLEELGGRIIPVLEKCKDKTATIQLPPLKIKGIDEDTATAHVAYGALLRTWKFDKYQTKKKDANKVHLKTLAFMTKSPKAAKKAFEPLNQVAEGVFLTRHVVSEPPNVIYPESLAKIAKELKTHGVGVELLNEAQMKKLGMGAILGVGQGSIRDSYMVLLTWKGGPKSQAPLAIVGKGVTFDTGGISIKPAQNMDEMKYDMAGSGVVLGLMRALAGRKAKVNVVGVMGLVENMPSGSAQRPGDVVTTMSGQTIEVLNTDAEGRLVLADALWYTQNRFKPQAMVDLATLTGAIVICLGNEHAGLFSNNDKLAKGLEEAGITTGEKLWRLPLTEAYDKDIDSTVADVQNIGSGRGAGSITAAQFLQRFVNNVPWAHLDIAGTAWDKKGRPLSVKGATAFGVRLLNNWIQTNYEK
ncbi:MAG: leucyl aminopeptidase [Alphaproteobacteria bacterium]|jgi:leucyl aminopeptidase|nr:leucyl aminopeptidase [Alphaproteobacteria bacterium]